MTGKELYTLYAEVLAQQDCGLDPWDEADEFERAAWEALAEKVELKAPGPRPAVLR